MNTGNYYNTKPTVLSKVSMLILALSPILSYYRVGEYFDYTMVLGLMTCIVAFGKGEFFSKFRYSNSYIVFWGYCWFCMLAFSGYFSLNTLIPGGLDFFVMSLLIALFADQMNISLLNRYTNYLFIFAGAIFLYQFASQFLTGNFTPMLLHIGDDIAYCGMSYQQLYTHQLYGSRPCSIFPEPAYFAVFCCYALTIELFCEKNRDKLATPLAIVMGMCILLSKSGTGLLTLAVIAVLKILQYSRDTSKNRLLFLLFLIIPMCIWGVRYYMSSEIGTEMAMRASEFSGQTSSTSGYVRVVQGYSVFDNYLSPFEKIFGASSKLYSDINDNFGFMNGFCSGLIKYGIAGMLLLVLFFIKNCNNKQIVVVSVVVVFLFISFIESTLNNSKGFLLALSLASSQLLAKNSNSRI